MGQTSGVPVDSDSGCKKEALLATTDTIWEDGFSPVDDPSGLTALVALALGGSGDSVGLRCVGHRNGVVVFRGNPGLSYLVKATT